VRMLAKFVREHKDTREAELSASITG
jgi:hypothetical protein